MEQYKFAKVVSSASGIRLYCTDESNLDSLITQLKQLFPHMRLEETHKLPSGEIYAYLLNGLSNYDDVRWWLIKYFCLKGWEPFDVASVVNTGFAGEAKTLLHYHFRYHINQ